MRRLLLFVLAVICAIPFLAGLYLSGTEHIAPQYRLLAVVLGIIASYGLAVFARWSSSE